MYNLGVMYEFGEGVEQDYSKAYDCELKAVEQGLPNAMFNLGGYFYEGKAVEQDLDKAAEWYRKALEAGLEPDGEKGKARLKDVLGDDYTQE